MLHEINNEKLIKMPELVAPAGNQEKLEMAIDYGADAVYFGFSELSLRSEKGFSSRETIEAAVKYAHQAGKKIYCAVNVFAHSSDLLVLENSVDLLAGAGVDAFIASDPGVIRFLKRNVPSVPIHLSTQANVTNYEAAMFWKEAGVQRIVLARELSLAEIAEIKSKSGLEIEVFVHGAMCISYSGRCMLSNYMTQRDANHGDCSHPCRYSYKLMEEKRPGELFTIEEDSRGTYIMNSKDLKLLTYIPELARIGVDALKIEGRTKSAYYVASIVDIYRQAIDMTARNEFTDDNVARLENEITLISNRGYTDGFIAGMPDQNAHEYMKTVPDSGAEFIAKIIKWDNGRVLVEQRNRFESGEVLQLMEPGGKKCEFTVSNITGENGSELAISNVPMQKVWLDAPQEIRKNSILRRLQGR